MNALGSISQIYMLVLLVLMIMGAGFAIWRLISFLMERTAPKEETEKKKTGIVAQSPAGMAESTTIRNGGPFMKRNGWLNLAAFSLAGLLVSVVFMGFAYNRNTPASHDASGSNHQAVQAQGGMNINTPMGNMQTQGAAYGNSAYLQQINQMQQQLAQMQQQMGGMSGNMQQNGMDSMMDDMMAQMDSMMGMMNSSYSNGGMNGMSGLSYMENMLNDMMAKMDSMMSMINGMNNGMNMNGSNAMNGMNNGINGMNNMGGSGNMGGMMDDMMGMMDYMMGMMKNTQQQNGNGSMPMM